MTERSDIDAELRRLAAATDGIAPRPGFSGRVMSRIAREAPSPWFVFGAQARRFFPLGMLAAAAALVWAVSVDNQVDEAIATSDDTELVW